MELQLRAIRKKAALSQQELADVLGVDVKTIGNWERGSTMMSLEQVWNCAVALDSTPNDICGWYLEYPHDEVIPARIDDPLKRQVVDAYDSMTQAGRESLAGVAKGLCALPENRPGDSRDRLAAKYVA